LSTISSFIRSESDQSKLHKLTTQRDDLDNRISGLFAISQEQNLLSTHTTSGDPSETKRVVEERGKAIEKLQESRAGIDSKIRALSTKIEKVATAAMYQRIEKTKGPDLKKDNEKLTKELKSIQAQIGKLESGKPSTEHTKISTSLKEKQSVLLGIRANKESFETKRGTAEDQLRLLNGNYSVYKNRYSSTELANTISKCTQELDHLNKTEAPLIKEEKSLQENLKKLESQFKAIDAKMKPLEDRKTTVENLLTANKQRQEIGEERYLAGLKRNEDLVASRGTHNPLEWRTSS